MRAPVRREGSVLVGPEDARSRAILDQMKIDEAKHAQMAEDSGAFELPRPLRRLMKITAGAMKAVAYRI